MHFDWEQRDFTQTMQLGMTQLTAFLNEFGMRGPVAPAAPPLLTGPVTAQTGPCEGAWRG